MFRAVIFGGAGAGAGTDAGVGPSGDGVVPGNGGCDGGGDLAPPGRGPGGGGGGGGAGGAPLESLPPVPERFITGQN